MIIIIVHSIVLSVYGIMDTYIMLNYNFKLSSHKQYWLLKIGVS